MSPVEFEPESSPERATPSQQRHDQEPDWQGPRELERRLTELESQVSSPNGTPVERLTKLETRIDDNRWFFGVVLVPVLLSAAALAVAIATAV